MELKLVTTKVPTKNEILYINPDNNYLAYKRKGDEVILDKGGSEVDRLIKCSDLKEILSKYLIKGTKYIINTYNPVLYYLIPGNPSNDSLFTSDNDFVPTLPIQSLIRGEVDGFNMYGFTVTQESVRSIKACDNWYNDLSELEDIEASIDNRVTEVFGYYKNFEDLDIEKEVRDKVGGYSKDILVKSFTASLISETKYTDSINIEDWVRSSMKGTNGVSGKLDVSYMYSKGGIMYGGQQSIKSFRYETNLTTEDTIIDLGDVQIEYIEFVLKIYPLNNDVDEVIINDCTLTIGVL